MADKDIEKTLQQLKDSLPKVIDSVKKYVDIADELDSVMANPVLAVKIKIKKKPVGVGDISKELAEKEGHLSDCEKALEDISELILRMDKILTVEKRTREMDAVRKAYQLQQNLLLDAIERTRKRFSELAKGNMPKDIQDNVKFILKKFDFYLNDKAEIEVTNDVRRSKKETAFVKVIAIEGNKRTAYLCISQNYDIEKAVFGKMLTSFFMDVRPKPPYVEGNKTWKSGGFETDFNRAVGLMLYHNMHDLLKQFPTNFKKYFKAPPKRLKQFIADNEFVYKVGNDVGKAPIATFLIRPEFLEKTKDGTPTGQYSEVKEKDILAKIRDIYPARKGIEMSRKVDKVTLRGVGGKKEEIYKLTIKLFPPGLT